MTGVQTCALPIFGDDDVATGLRVTRLPTEPSLGSRARKKRAARLREDSAKLVSALEEVRSRAGALDKAHRALDTLFVDLAILDAGDPTSALAAARETSTRVAEEARVARDTFDRSKVEASEIRRKLEPIRTLANDGPLLDLPDQGALAGEISRALTEAREAASHLARHSEAYTTLAAFCHALESPIPNDDRSREEKAALEIERDRAFRAVLALEAATLAARDVVHPDAERLLSERSAVVPALEETHAHARDEAARADTNVAAADAAWEMAAHAAREADVSLARGDRKSVV